MIGGAVADRIPPARAARVSGAVEPTAIRPRGAATAGALRPGTVLGHTYVIEHLLGRGTLGEVYRARHVELGTAHAVKLLPPSLADDPKIVSLLVEEARKLSRVRHEAVVNYEGLFRDEQGLRYLVMEHVDGPSLATVIAGRRLEADEVLLLRDRLGAGLAAVHARGIVHRDLSPDNIILPDGEVGRAKLTGFGFAKTGDAGDATLIGVNLMARHSYASPEQLGLFGGRVDTRSDYYSLGLVLAAAAIGFGRTLDMGATPAAAIAARQKAPDLASVPAPLRAAIAPLLEPRPDDRPASLRAFSGAAFPGAGLTDDRSRPRSRRIGWRIAAGGAMAALLLGAVVVVALLREGPRVYPALDEVHARLAAAAAIHGCGPIAYTLLPDRSVRLSGNVATADDLARLRLDVAAIAGIGSSSVDVQVMSPTHCDIIALLTPLSDAGRSDGLAIALASRTGAVHLGERPSFEVNAPGFDSYVYVDYVDSGGQVLHLYPNDRDRFNLRPWRNRFVLFKAPLWTVCGNPGRQMVTAMAAERPMFPSRRPGVEDAQSYIASLGEAVKQLPRDRLAAALLFFELREAPPWINRELACPAAP